jgi:hypothetical protein
VFAWKDFGMLVTGSVAMVKYISLPVTTTVGLEKESRSVYTIKEFFFVC